MKTSALLVLTAATALLTGGLQAASIFTIGTAATTGGVNNWPAGEPPAAAIDGNSATKYLNFAELNTGFIFTLTSGTATATGINFTTANDAEARDPASYILYGSNTAVASGTIGTVYDVDANFAQIASGALSLSSTRLTAGGDVTFTSSTAYSTFLLVFPTVKDAAAANSMQIAEAMIQTGAGPLGNAGVIGGGQLTVIPEPGTTGLAALGVLGFLTARRRR